MYLLYRTEDRMRVQKIIIILLLLVGYAYCLLHVRINDPKLINLLIRPFQLKKSTKTFNTTYSAMQALLYIIIMKKLRSLQRTEMKRKKVKANRNEYRERTCVQSAFYPAPNTAK